MQYPIEIYSIYNCCPLSKSKFKGITRTRNPIGYSRYKYANFQVVPDMSCSYNPTVLLLKMKGGAQWLLQQIRGRPSRTIASVGSVSIRIRSMPLQAADSWPDIPRCLNRGKCVDKQPIFLNTSSYKSICMSHQNRYEGHDKKINYPIETGFENPAVICSFSCVWTAIHGHRILSIMISGG